MRYTFTTSSARTTSETEPTPTEREIEFFRNYYWGEKRGGITFEVIGKEPQPPRTDWYSRTKMPLQR